MKKGIKVNRENSAAAPHSWKFLMLSAGSYCIVKTHLLKNIRAICALRDVKSRIKYINIRVQ